MVFNLTHSEQSVMVLLVATSWMDGHKLGTGLIKNCVVCLMVVADAMMKKELVFNLTHNTECVKVVFVHRHHF